VRRIPHRGTLSIMNGQRTLYCGNRHRTADGVPVAHSCRVLTPEYLAAERREEYGRAASLLESMPLILHPGVGHTPDAQPREPRPLSRVAIAGGGRSVGAADWTELD
jgi:hypothetical protein